MTEKDWEHLNYVISQRGYLVVGCYREYAIGEVIDEWQNKGFFVNHPLTVVKVTDEKDFSDQVKMLNGHTAGGWGYYYRCITD